MTHEDVARNQDPTNSFLTVKEQEERLKPILEKNMHAIVSDSDFFKRLKDRYPQIHGGNKIDEGNNDVGVVVSRHGYGKRLEDGSWEEGEAIQVGFKRVFGDKASGTSFVHVANRVDTPEGRKLVPDEFFTGEQAAMEASMVDELMLAKLSGEIPQLHEFSLDTIFVPQPHNSLPY